LLRVCTRRLKQNDENNIHHGATNLVDAREVGGVARVELLGEVELLRTRDYMKLCASNFKVYLQFLNYFLKHRTNLEGEEKVGTL
jgi:hypothetical protein